MRIHRRTFVFLLVLLFGGVIIVNRHTPQKEKRYIQDMIRIHAPMPNALIEKEINIEGRARGMWFFEATFPIVLEDGYGNEILSSYATASGKWMTTEFVPFSLALEVPTAATKKGTMVFKRANASGLPEHDAELRIPVLFSEQ